MINPSHSVRSTKQVLQNAFTLILISLLTLNSFDIQGQMNVEVLVSDVTCLNAENGIVELIISGNQCDPIIQWIDFPWGPDIPSGRIQAGFPVGTFHVTVEDPCVPGSFVAKSFTISEPQKFVAYFAEATYVSGCNVCDGTVTLVIEGGTPPYDFDLPQGASISDEGIISGLCKGTTAISFRDANDCATAASTNLGCEDFIVDSTTSDPAPDPSPGPEPEPDPDPNPTSTEMSVSSQVTTATCAGLNNSLVEVTVSGTACPPTIQWLNTGPNGSLGGTAFIESGISAGTYSFVVEDPCTLGAIEFHEIIVGEPEVFIAQFTEASHASGCDVCDGTAKLEIQGGTAPFNYELPGGVSVSPDGLLTGLCKGDITISFIDANGCATAASTLIECGDEIPPTTETPTVIGDLFVNVAAVHDKLGNIWIIKKNLQLDGKAFKVFSLSGALVSQGVLETQSTLLDSSDFTPGVYVFQNGKSAVKFIKR